MCIYVSNQYAINLYIKHQFIRHPKIFIDYYKDPNENANLMFLNVK